MPLRRATRRRGTSLVEAAFALPVTFFLLFALVVGGIGIFRYQQVAHLARETARYAAVHGGQYAKENRAAIQAKTLPDVNLAYLVDQVAKARSIGLAADK